MSRKEKSLLEELIDDVVRKYGFENAVTINFCQVCEDIENAKKEIEDAFYLYIILFA